MAGNDKSPGCFRTFLEVIGVAVAAISALIAFSESREKRQALVEIEKLRERIEVVEGQLKRSEEKVREQQKELEKSLETFARYYRDKVANVTQALGEYERFDTPNNRKELGGDFEKRRAERLEAVRTKLESLVDFVKRWRSVLEALRGMLDGQIDALETDIAKGDALSMVRRFTVLRDNLESEIDRLKKALAAAVKSEATSR